MEADFSGYATKAGLKCSDGRTILPNAFQKQDGTKVPLVWAHDHSGPEKVLGHCLLENREDGVYAYGFFNETEAGKAAKSLVTHGDVSTLSIYANQLVERAKSVLHGAIREVSLVLAGANPGALIDNVRIAHSDDDIETVEEEAIIYTGLPLEHTASESEEQGSEPGQEPGNESGSEAGTEEASTEVPEATAPAAAPVQDQSAQSTQAAEPVQDQNAQSTADAAATTDESGAIQHAEGEDGKSFNEVYATLDEDQKALVHTMVEAALVGADGATHSDMNSGGEPLTHQEGTANMTGTRNVFEQDGTKQAGPTLSHDQLKTIVETAHKVGSFKEAFLAHAEEYGITDIDFLFPDARNVTSQPDFIKRRTEWVAAVVDGAKHSPFSRIKSLAADVTADEARAKGYVKGNLKKDEVIKLLKRVTTPTTIYKKQKLDRDDIVDITDLDVVAWLKAEMRMMLEEEIGRAILIGDGREPDDEDKIDEDKLRPIAWDHEMYAHPVTVPANVSPDGIVESVLRARKFYKGSGRPTFFTTDDIVTDMLLIKDKMGRRIYMTETELAAALRVDSLVVVEVMEDTPDLLGIIVNMSDYTIGADRGGQLAMFDDFDIDYNQYKYLMETRISGALTKPKSAVVIKRTSGTTVTPTVPTFDPETNTITIPTVAGVTYYDAADDSVMTAGDNVIAATTDVEARPNTGYNFPHNTDADWTFAYTP